MDFHTILTNVFIILNFSIINVLYFKYYSKNDIIILSNNNFIYIILFILIINIISPVCIIDFYFNKYHKYKCKYNKYKCNYNKIKDENKININKNSELLKDNNNYKQYIYELSNSNNINIENLNKIIMIINKSKLDLLNRVKLDLSKLPNIEKNNIERRERIFNRDTQKLIEDIHNNNTINTLKKRNIDYSQITECKKRKSY